jgi:hypothetical protein
MAKKKALELGATALAPNLLQSRYEPRFIKYFLLAGSQGFQRISLPR